MGAEKPMEGVVPSKAEDDEAPPWPLKQRGCTDIFFILLFIAHWVGFVIVTLAGVENGQPSKLFLPRDYRGDYCGIDDQWNDGRKLVGFDYQVHLMNVSKTVDDIANQLLCSTVAERALKESGALSGEELDAYMCACCKLPCAGCNAVLDVEDLQDTGSFSDTVSGRMGELTSRADALSLFSPGGMNGDMFQGVFQQMAFFQTVCVTECGVAGYNGSDWRSHTFSPYPDSPLKTAWDRLKSLDGPYEDIQKTMNEKFVFKALPKSICPYDAVDCVLFPGVTFTEVTAGYCTFQIAGDVAGMIGSAGTSLGGVNDLTGQISESFGSWMGDIMATYDVLLIVCVVAFVVSLIFLLLLRFFVGYMVWAALFLVFAILVVGGSASLVRSQQCKGLTFTDAGWSYASQSAQLAESVGSQAIEAGVAAGTQAYESQSIDNLTIQSFSIQNEKVDGNGASYRGFQTRTRMGRECQPWNESSPHNHTFTTDEYPEAGLAENYCRNPSDSTTIWCFTTDPSVKWGYCNPMGYSALLGHCPSGYVVESEVARKALLVSALTLWVLALTWVVVVLCLRSRVRLAIAINKVAAQFIYTTPQIIVVPVLQAVLAIAWNLLWVFCASFLLSQVRDEYPPSEPFATYAEAYGTTDTPGKCNDVWPQGFVWKDHGDLLSASDPCSGNMGDTTGIVPRCWRCSPPRYALDLRFAASFFAYLWNNAFLVDLGKIIIACACAAWFFRAKGRRSGCGIMCFAVRTVFRYHAGTVAFGSFILAVVQFIRWFLFYLERQAEAQKNRVMQLVLKALQSCLWCFEQCLKFLTKHAYIQVAIMGTNFCTSAKNAFQLLWRNVLRFGFLTALGNVIGAIGIVCITAGNTVVGYFILIAMYPGANPIVPVVLYACVSFVVAKIYMNVFTLATDCMLQCFITTEEEKIGLSCVPFELHRLLPDHKVETE